MLTGESSVDDLELFRFFKNTKVNPKFEFHGLLQNSLAKLFSDTFSSTEFNSDTIGPIRFIPSKDKRISEIEYEHYYVGATVSDAIVKIENEFPIAVAAIPTEDGGYDITLEYYKRWFAYV